MYNIYYELVLKPLYIQRKEIYKYKGIMRIYFLYKINKLIKIKEKESIAYLNDFLN